MAARLNLKGKRFDRLVVISIKTGVRNKSGQLSWFCKCDCGGTKIVTGATLVRGMAKSCGCLQKENAYNMSRGLILHGSEPKRLYSIWGKMKGRVHCKTSPDYAGYGARGISIMFTCFEDFRDWALKNGYSEKLTLDRIDNDGPYSRDNCRWTTAAMQSRNTRRNVWFTNPKTGERLCEVDWCKRLNIRGGNVSFRIRQGWDLVDALTEPARPGKHYQKQMGAVDAVRI